VLLINIHGPSGWFSVTFVDGADELMKNLSFAKSEPNAKSQLFHDQPSDQPHCCCTASFPLNLCIKQSHNVLLLIHGPSGWFSVFFVDGADKKSELCSQKSVVSRPSGPPHCCCTASFSLYGSIEQSHNVLLLIYGPSGWFSVTFVGGADGKS
jgi:hypothetical protein